MSAARLFPRWARLTAALLCLESAAGRAQEFPADATPAIRELLDRAEALESTDSPAALALLEKVVVEAAAGGNAAARREALTRRCWILAVNQPETAIAEVAKDLGEFERAVDGAALGELRVCRGYAHERAGRANEAAAEYEFGVEQGRRLGAERLLGRALVLRGEARYTLGSYSDALADLKEAYDIEVRRRDTPRENYALNAIANLYADAHVGQFERALEIYLKQLAVREKQGNLREVAVAHFNIASTLERLEKPAQALPHYQMALRLDAERGDEEEAAYDERSVGIVLSKLGRSGEALRHIDRALDFYLGTGEATMIAYCRLSRGAVLGRLGRASEALVELDLARGHFESAGNARFLSTLHDERALALAARGEWREAFAARGDQLEAEKVLTGSLRDEQTSRLRVQFDTERKEAENRTLQREAELRDRALAQAEKVEELQRWVLLLSAGVIVSLAVLGARQVVHGRRMRALALTDELTRLPNRRHLQVLLDASWRGIDAAERFALLALDIDHFKRVNDEFGHDVGDQVLRRVAHAARASLRPGDAIGRTGGEEFVALLPGAERAAAVAVGERIRAAVESLDWPELTPGRRVTVSVGAAISGEIGAKSASGLWKRADEALYLAKEQGRNRVVVAVA